MMCKGTKIKQQILPLLLVVALLCMPLTVQAATGVTLNQGSASMKVGESLTLQAGVEKGEIGELAWSTSDSQVADVSDGMVTAKQAGNATITVTAEDGSATCQITVSSSTTPVTGISLSQSSLSLKTGDITTLSPTVAPDNATNKTISWSSSNSAVAEVNDSGAVYANAAGTATITATTQDGGKSAFCQVTVETPAVTVTGVTLDPSNLELKVGGTATLRATVAPDNAQNKNVSWGSSNSQVATVDGNGMVTAKGEGSTTVTVTAGQGSKTATCTVQVKPGAIAVASIRLNQNDLSLKAGETSVLVATISPDTASNKNMSWTSSNTKVADVNSSGTVTAKEAGTADITVTTTDGSLQATCRITVPKGDIAVTGVKLEKEKLALTVGKTAQLNANLVPLDATKKELTWQSDNEKIATVDSKGLVTAKAEGKATITVKTVDGAKTAACAVTVTKELVVVTGITLDMQSLNLAFGKTATLTAKIQPLNATDVNLRWSTSNPSVATVENGIVKGVAAGEAVITVKTEEGQKSATCTVTVSGGASPSPAPKGSNSSMFLWIGLGLLVLAIGAGIALVLVVKRMKKNGAQNEEDDFIAYGDTGPINTGGQNSGVPYIPMDEGVEIDQSAFPLEDYDADAAYDPNDSDVEIDQSAFQKEEQPKRSARDFQDMNSSEMESLEDGFEIADEDDPTWRG